jgi:hypothetical protein
MASPRSLHAAAATILATTLVAAATTLVAPATSVVAADKLPAVGSPYPGLDPDGPERAVGGQVWWSDDDGSGFGHIHGDMVLPVGQKISGRLDVPVRVVFHNNPSRLRKVELVMLDHDGDRVTLGEVKPDKTCPYDGTESTCAWDWTFPIETSRYRDGDRLIRLRIFAVTPDDREFETSSRIPVTFANGDTPRNREGPLSTCPKRSFQFLGWYGAPIDDYTRVSALCLPRGPVSGILEHVVQGWSGDEVSRLTVTLSRTHAIPATGEWRAQPARAGRVLFDRRGSFKNPVTIKIDTRDLADGWHSLNDHVVHPKGAESKCPYPCAGENHLEASAVSWIYVSN